MLSRFGIGLVTLMGFATNGHAQGFDADLFERWVDMRVGSGEPVYWYSSGTIREYPGGKLLATIEGYDTARLDTQTSTPSKAIQLSRKIYVYRDAETGEIATDSEGQPVAPIAYPYQLITYEDKSPLLETFVEQGRAPALQKIGPGNDMAATKTTAGVIFSAPLYLDFPTADGGRYQTFEHYDFFSPTGADNGEGVIVFIRYGDAPSWMSGVEKIVMHMTTERIVDRDDVPARLRDWIDSEYPMWRVPPADMKEIRALQAPQD